MSAEPIYYDSWYCVNPDFPTSQNVPAGMVGCGYKSQWPGSCMRCPGGPLIRINGWLMPDGTWDVAEA